MRTDKTARSESEKIEPVSPSEQNKPRTPVQCSNEIERSSERVTPRVTKHTLTYTETHAVNFQSVTVSKGVEYLVEDDEDADAVFKDLRRELVRDVRATADKSIERYDVDGAWKKRYSSSGGS